MDCVVLSLQDSAVFYPSCGGCFSRIDVEQLGTARCSKCGHLCRKDEINYRYRLSLSVSRDEHIFGITVFGSNLNQFFGIDATGLQRLVHNTDGPVEPSRKFTLLLKAIKDCFIGRHFIFCMKLTENDRRPWLQDPVPNHSSSKDVTRLIATQMILPEAARLEGCAVVTYYEKLLKKALDSHCTYLDDSRPSIFPTTQLLLTPHHSTISSFDSTLPSPQFLFPSTHWSRHIDSVLSLTPPWQQSLEVVTSSAEQKESDSLQDCGDKTSIQIDNSAISHQVCRGCQQKHAPTEKKSVFHFEESLSSPSYDQYQNSLKKSARTSSKLSTSFTLSEAAHSIHDDKVTELSPKELTRTLLSSSVDWEDLPLSESLTEFICGGNKDFNIVVDTEPNIIVLHQKNSAGSLMEMKNLTNETTFAGQRYTQLTESHSQILRDVNNVPNDHGRQEFSKQESKSMIFPQFDNQNEFKLHFENEEQHSIEDGYNCSADLFGNSSLVCVNAKMLSSKAEIVGTTTEVCPLSLNPDPKPLNQSSSKNYSRDSLTIQDFIPSSQSTPNIKACMSHLFKSACRKLTHEFSSEADRQYSEGYFENMCELNSKKTVSATFLHPQLNSLVSAGQLSQCGNTYANEKPILSTTPSRWSYKRMGRWLRKLDENKNPLPSHRYFGMQKRRRNLQLSGAMSHRHVSGVLTESVSDNDSSEMLVPPTPVRKSLQSVPQHETQQPADCSSPLSSSIVQQQRVTDDCKITVISAHRGEGPTECVANDGNLDLSNDFLPVFESWKGDWSRDLFSDSV